jgi:Plasmid recombination enzyme/Toprim-like
MEQYSVLHMIKVKELGGIGMHIDRHYTQHNVDSSRSYLNEELSKYKGMELSEAVTKRIEEGYKKQSAIRRDAVKAIGVMLTGSHEQMKKLESDQAVFKQWKEANYKFACEHFGERNIVRFSVHRDEKTPHIHCIFVPITQEGGLSAKSYMDGKDHLKSYQDQYGKVMEKFGLSRGLSKDITQEVHISTSDYYRETSKIIREAETKTEQIKLSNVLNLNQVRDSVQEEMVRGHRLALDYKEKAEQRERMYKELLEKEIKQDLERVKREVNLVKHVASMGYKLDRDKSCGSYAVMEKGGDKLVIRTGPNEQGHWTYGSVSDMYMSPKGEKDKGTIVDFMINRGYSFKDVRGLSSNHLDNTMWEIIQKEKRLLMADKEVQKALVELHLSSVKPVPYGQKNYLEKRGINADTYKMYEGNGLEVSEKAVFALYQNLDHEFKGTPCSTISYYFEEGESRQRFHHGLHRGLSVLNGNSNQVMILESPVDGLSHKEKNGGNITYISTCGNLIKQVKEELEEVIKTVKSTNKELLLSFDNDPKGIEMSKEVEKMCKNIGVTPKLIQPSIGKDWNEELMKERVMEKEKNKRRVGLGMGF